MSSRRIINISRYIADIAKFTLFGKTGRPEIKPSPNSMKIAVTNLCNSRCITCNYWKNDSTKDQLTTEEVKSAILQAKNIGIKSVLLYGGEPLMRRDIFELITYARAIDLRTTIITNGLLLNEERTENLVRSGISHTTISIHGRDEIHDQIMGIQGAYKRAVRGAKLLRDSWSRHRRDEMLPLMINSLIMKPTIENDNIDFMVKLCKDLDAQFGMNFLDPNIPYFDIPELRKLRCDSSDAATLEILFKKLISISQKEPRLVEAPKIVLTSFLGQLKDAKRSEIPCIQGFLGPVYLDNVGNIHACSVLKPLGNIKAQTLKEVVFSKEWKQRAEDMYHLKCPKCFCGYFDRVWYHLPFAWKELTGNLIRLKFSRNG